MFLWHFPWGRPRRALPGTVPPWSPDFPPPAPGQAPAGERPSDRLAWDNMGSRPRRRYPQTDPLPAGPRVRPPRASHPSNGKSPHSRRMISSSRRSGFAPGAGRGARLLLICRSSKNPSRGPMVQRGAACRHRRRLLLLRCSCSEIPEPVQRIPAPAPAIDFGANVLGEGVFCCSLLQQQRNHADAGRLAADGRPPRAWLAPDPCGDSADRASPSVLHWPAAPGCRPGRSEEESGWRMTC